MLGITKDLFNEFIENGLLMLNGDSAGIVNILGEQYFIFYI